MAVAVSASTGMSPSWPFRSRSWRYAGRKSWPQWLMQCASSTTTRLIGQSAMKPRRPPRERLGRDVEQLQLAAAELLQPLRAAPSSSSVELSTAARKPFRSSASTWSFISEMSGEMTSTVPPSSLRRDLERERLAGAGRHDADAVAAGEHRVDDLALARAERLVAEQRFEDLLADRTLSVSATCTPIDCTGAAPTIPRFRTLDP